MTTPEAINYLWQLKAEIGIFFLPAIVLAAFCVPEYLSHAKAKRIRILKTILIITSLFLIVPCVTTLGDERPFWEALLIPQSIGSRRMGLFLWGLVIACVLLIFLAAELVKQRKSTSAAEKS
jgi:hypothetical protein